MPDERIWYLWTGEGQKGPYTAAELLAWKQAGNITDEWHVWREGFANWQKIADTPELSSPASKPLTLPAKETLPQQASTVRTEQAGTASSSEKRVMYCPRLHGESESFTKCGHCGLVFKEWGKPWVQASPKEAIQDSVITISRVGTQQKADLWRQALLEAQIPVAEMSMEKLGDADLVCFKIPSDNAPQACCILSLYEKNLRGVEQLRL